MDSAKHSSHTRSLHRNLKEQPRTLSPAYMLWDTPLTLVLEVATLSIRLNRQLRIVHQKRILLAYLSFLIGIQKKAIQYHKHSLSYLHLNKTSRTSASSKSYAYIEISMETLIISLFNFTFRLHKWSKLFKPST